MKAFAAVVGRTTPSLLARIAEVLRVPESEKVRVVDDGACALVMQSGAASRSARLAGNVCNEQDVLRWWEGEGEACVERVTGEFSFAIWDGQQLFCARDRFGVRSLYYARTRDGLIVSDTLVAVMAHPDVDLALDDVSVADFLAIGTSEHAEATIYRGIRRVPPAHTLAWKRHEMKIRRYWDVPEPALSDADANDFRARLEEAIVERLTSREAVVFMSGGLDSTTLASLARSASPQVAITAVTSVYRKRIEDIEEQYAIAAARSIGIPLEVNVLDDFAPLGALEAGLWTPEPGPLQYAEATRTIYAAVARMAPVALHGHPADALLLQDLIPYVRDAGLRVLPALVRYAWIARRAPWFALRAWFAAPHPKTSLESPAWLVPEFREHVAERRAGGVRPAAVDSLRAPGWASYFEWAHPSFTGAAVELSYPYADHRLIDVALSMRPIPWFVKKHVLREILRGRMTDSVRLRRKAALRGDPWRVETTRAPEIDAASAYIDARRLEEEVHRTGFLANATMRAIVFDYWLQKRGSFVTDLRRDIA